MLRLATVSCVEKCPRQNYVPHHLFHCPYCPRKQWHLECQWEPQNKILHQGDDISLTQLTLSMNISISLWLELVTFCLLLMPYSVTNNIQQHKITIVSTTPFRIPYISSAVCRFSKNSHLLHRHYWLKSDITKWGEIAQLCFWDVYTFEIIFRDFCLTQAHYFCDTIDRCALGKLINIHNSQL